MLTERQQEIHFRKLLNKDCNSKCADCKTKGATWASLGFGVFVCITCSGVHRSFGMHITRVRSTKLDSWTKEDAKLLEIIGNKTANLFWEGNLNNNQFSDGNYSNFIRRKYDQKLYVKKNVEDPVAYVEKRHFDVKSTSMRNYYLNKEVKRHFKSQMKKNKFNLKINKNLKKQKKQDDVDFLFMDDSNNNKKENDKIDDLLFLDLTSNPQNLKKKENTFQNKIKTENNFDFDLTGNKNNKVIKKEITKDDFFIDFSQDINTLNRTHSSNLEQQHHNMNIFNIQHLNIYNNNQNPNNNINGNNLNNNNGYQIRKDSDKYSAFDYFRHY